MKHFFDGTTWIEIPTWIDRAEPFDNRAYGKTWNCDTHNVWVSDGRMTADFGDMWPCIKNDCRVEVFTSTTSSNNYPVHMVYNKKRLHRFDPPPFPTLPR